MGNRNSNPLLSNVIEFQRDLLDWYKATHRILPWRTEPTPYKTVISEFMLQQTQVTTVLPYFERWLERFPNFRTLAEADEATVLKHWEGLGYYSRARNVHRLAQNIILLENLPQTASEWLVFKGVGPYTAAAIASIAFNDPVAVVDGNVIRILSRLTADATLFKDNGSAFKAFTPIADALINENDPGNHNQAMMELGATVCTKNNPLCTTCPVAKHCKAVKQGDANNYPNLQRKQITLHAVRRAWVVHEDKLLLHQKRGSSKRLADLFELPDCEDLLRDSLDATQGTLLLKKKRGISNQRIEESIYAIPPTQALMHHTAEDSSYYWVPRDQLNEITLSGPHRRWVKELIEKT
jgi:A/G-specific adenine glycosylase